MRRIKIGLVALAALTVLLPTEASRAQDAYPTRLVRIVVPYPAGGGTDTLARLLADQLSRKWGQPAIVENIGGAAGNIGSAEVARATPDGYTLLLASPGPIATNAFLYKEMGYDPARWVPIALLATGPYVLVLRKNFEASKVADLIARAKANPGKITSATPGAGSVGHLATVQLEMLAGITTAQIPYRGLSHALNDLIAGHVDMMFDTPTTSLALHRDGKVKIVAVGTTERVRELPEVPTVAESGLPGGAAADARGLGRQDQSRCGRDPRSTGRGRKDARNSDGAGHQKPRGGSPILRRGGAALGQSDQASQFSAAIAPDRKSRDGCIRGSSCTFHG
jgi:tripartite-type tricarboxylate transporter receptor subunit TctC